MDDVENARKNGERMNSYRSGPPGEAARATKSVSGETAPSRSDAAKTRQLPPLRFRSPSKDNGESES
jgi:hypothetical protein